MQKFNISKIFNDISGTVISCSIIWYTLWHKRMETAGKKILHSTGNATENHIRMSLAALDNVYTESGDIYDDILLNNCVCSVQHNINILIVVIIVHASILLIHSSCHFHTNFKRAIFHTSPRWDNIVCYDLITSYLLPP